MRETIYARYMHKRPLLLSVIFLVLGAILAATAVGAQTFLEQIDDEEEAIVSFEAEIESLEEQITDYENELSDIADLVAETEARIAIEDEKLSLLPIYLELMADNLIDRYVSLEEPTSVRHVMAIDAYVRNDEHIHAVLTQSIQLSEEALEQIRARLLYESIINDANDQLLVIYGQLRQLGREIDSLFDRRNQSNERRTLALENRSEAMSIVPGIEEQIDGVLITLTEPKPTHKKPKKKMHINRKFINHNALGPSSMAFSMRFNLKSNITLKYFNHAA